MLQMIYQPQVKSKKIDQWIQNIGEIFVWIN